ncbi:hypothetical protein CCACVL1_11882 [Corchorus capsularis]|uniref:Protein kinase domain-containing protein n=1 Tax=Corchorus capsularis TaxID=210143 RepID=A0A1R3IJ23_COCAP|nr:hypothetical protein CCACVL1_11882 [Corchorus capsularis]
MDFLGHRIRVLGNGSYGKVHLVKIISGGLLFGHLIAEKTSEETLIVEKEILDQFHGSPHIIQCYGCSSSIDYEAIVFSLFLELASGGSLLELMEDYGGQIPEEHVKCYVEMVLKGLVEIHSRGYVHCDLKPENILVFHRGDCSDLPILKIADFGLAQVRGVKNMRKWDYGFCGTPTYISPESIVGQIWGALDVWSLGCIVIEMITGRPAWGNYQGPEDMRDKLLRGQKPDIPENMSAWGKDFLKRCFGTGPNERWTARMLLEHPFLQPESETILLPHEMSFTNSADNEEKSSTLGTTKFSDSICPESTSGNSVPTRKVQGDREEKATLMMESILEEELSNEYDDELAEDIMFEALLRSRKMKIRPRHRMLLVYC